MMLALVASASCNGNPSTAPVPLEGSERVFDDSVLHEIHIEVAPEYIPALEYDDEQRIPCTFTFDGTTLEHVAIRQKGQGSQAGSLHSKPSLSVRFDELVPGQTLHGLDKLILNNAFMDPTLMHEPLGYDLYQRTDIPSRRTAHAVVTMSGMRTGDQSFGVYVMVEAVNKTLLARHFGAEHDNGNLFEDENAGDFAEDPYAIDLKNDHKPSRSRQRLVEFADFLHAATDQELIDRLDEFIDLERALDSFALDLLTQHSDGFWLAAHNYYMYEHPVDHRFIMLPHGMDLLFEPSGRSCGMVPDPLTLPTTMGERIAAHPALRQRVEQSIVRILDDVWDVAHMEARIDALGVLLDTSSHDEPAFLSDRSNFHIAQEALKHLLRNNDQVWRNATSATCGDGVRSGNELCVSMCDDGNLVDGDGCSAQCVLEFCGDWIVQPGIGEVCEIEPGCRWDCGAIHVCGDGVRDEGELCDDGNVVDDDACNNACTPNCTHEMRDGEVYAFCPHPAPYLYAPITCGLLHATPAVPRSPDEHAWLVQRTQAHAAGAWWMGLDSYAGQWWTADGLPLTWEGWGANQPDELDDGACALIDPALSGAWNDRPCQEEHPIICKLF
jgi:cysteine-rich repeat protein